MNPSGSGVLHSLVVLLLVFVILDRYAYATKDIVNTLSSVNQASNLSSTDLAPPHLVDNAEEKSHGDEDKLPKEEVKKSNINEKNAGEKKDNTLDDPRLKDTGRSQSSKVASESKTVPAEDAHVEGCDPDSRCIDEKNKFIACLRVPGKDSLDISLLIQNRGHGDLVVKIVAPNFVSLEDTAVNLKGEENKEVKVSIHDGANDTTIVLRAGEGNCSLRLSNMIPASAGNKTSRTTPFLHLPLHTSSASLLLAALLLIGAVWFCIRIWRTRNRSVLAYEKVEMDLPVSAGGDKQFEVVDGWDNSWGDDWDDEEAPKTPLKSVSTPSSKGLASRKSSKDGWKD